MIKKNLNNMINQTQTGKNGTVNSISGILKGAFDFQNPEQRNFEKKLSKADDYSSLTGENYLAGDDATENFYRQVIEGV